VDTAADSDATDWDSDATTIADDGPTDPLARHTAS
jgi:hypothetical protein